MDDRPKASCKRVLGRTRISVEEQSFTWVIENFSMCPCDVDECIESPPFTTGSFNLTTWDLFVYPKGQKKNNSVGKVGVYLEKLTDVGSHQASYKISILDRDGNACYSSFGDHLFKNKGSNKGWPSFISRDVLLKFSDALLPKDTLTLSLEMKVSSLVSMVSSTMSKIENEGNEVENICDLMSLSNNLKLLYESERFCDIRLKSDGKEFRAHKTILAAGSPVFAAMFEHDMMEKNEHCVTICDISSKVTKELLNYLYTGKVEKLTYDLAAGLYDAGDKYAITDLKTKCSKYLSANLAIDNICEVLLRAYLHNDANLKKDAESFLCSNSAKILRTEGWDFLVGQNPVLATELIRTITKNST